MNIYDEIGVTKVINAAGSMTVLGGSLIAPEVLDAMNRAAGSFVRMHELAAWAGKAIAEITSAGGGLVTSGASGGIFLSAAACMTGPDREKMDRLPDTTGLKNEIIIQHLHRIPFDLALRTVGAQIVEVGDEQGTRPEQIESAITEDTAALFHVIFDPQPTVPLKDAIDIAHRHELPLILDVAAELPPVENLKKFIIMGADLVIFSGGKDIGGPNDSGILCGRKDLIQAAALQAFPNYGIGRPLKVSKEQMVGLVFALRRYATKDHDADSERWEAMTAYMLERLQDIPGVDAEIAFPRKGPRPLGIPRVRLKVDEEVLGRTVSRVVRALGQDTPAVEVYAEPEEATIWINPQHLLRGEEKIVAKSVDRALRSG